MGESTKIEWCDATWNPWIGCSKVSPECANCYAEALASGPMQLSVWGPHAPRKRTAESTWDAVRKWDSKAKAEGVLKRVFLASLADIMEDHPQLDAWRAEMWGCIRPTTNLIFLCLSKRPERYAELIPPDLLGDPRLWLGTTVGHPEWTHRLDALCATPAALRFVSAEPLLDYIDFRPWIADGLGWVILGGESQQKGRACRASDIRWFQRMGGELRGLVPVFQKQLGTIPYRSETYMHRGKETTVCMPWKLQREPKKGGDPADWPESIRVREIPVEAMRRTRPQQAGLFS
ncbi:MAG: DUF5131 family protein [Planctomycetaceae bacterium]